MEKLMMCSEAVLSLDIKNVDADLLIREIILNMQNNLWKCKL